MNRIRGGSGAQVRPSRGLGEPTANLPEQAVEKLFDKTGRPIELGDIVKVFHFVGARNKRHYMYKQAIGIDHLGPSAHSYLKLSHLSMDESRRGYYLERLDGRLLADYEIVQSVDARFEDRDRLNGSQSGGEPREDGSIGRRATTNSPTITFPPGGKP
jgi:hypothetical protein